MLSRDFDLCVIGGGSAGLVTASAAAQLGARVVLVERAHMGGECLNTGCVPSKALLRAAEVAHLARTGSAHGLADAATGTDLPRVFEHVRSVISRIAPHDSVERFQSLGVLVRQGHARFIDAHRIDVEGECISARKFVIATGSQAVMPRVPGLDTVPFLTNETLFELDEAVPHLLIVGAGPVGVEMAQAFRRLGSDVTLLESGARLLPRDDAQAAEVVSSQLRSEGIDLLCAAQICQVAREGGQITLTLETGNIERRVSGSHLLLAAGRRPSIESLGLDAAGVGVKAGQLVVDGRLRTSQRHIFACGDVVGPHRFTHMAEHQAGVVIRNLIFRLPARIETRVIPHVTFTDPELAQVGLTQAEAEAAAQRHEVFQMPYADIDRAVTDSAERGFVKVIANRRGRILGATIVGRHAGELIHEYALAMRNGLKLSAISRTIHAYPTYAQANRLAADQRMKQNLTPRTQGWIKRLAGLRGTA